MTEKIDGSPQQIEPVEAKIKLEGIEDFRHYCLRFTAGASRTLEILSYDLDAALYDQQSFLAAVKDLCLRSQFNKVRILLQNNEQVQRHGHRLVELARRLSSSIEIRHPHPDHIDHQENFLVVDRSAYIKWRWSNRYRGAANHNDRLQAQRLSDLFNEIWQRSQSDSELRRLYL